MWLTDISETETRRLSSFHVTLSRENCLLIIQRCCLLFFMMAAQVIVCVRVCDELCGGDADKHRACDVCTKQENGAED